MNATTTRALLSTSAVQALLDRDEDQVLALIQSGKLAWAWDFRAPGAKRACLRVLRQCVADLCAGRPGLTGEEDWERILGLIFPHRPQVIASRKLSQIFTLSSTHTCDFIKHGLLKTQGRRRHRRAAYPVEFGSVERLLLERRFVG